MGSVTIERATEADATLLANLLELYIHDMSVAFPNVEIGADGRFGYPRLPLYWSEPHRRFAFLIRTGGRVLGFALVTRGSPASDDPEVLDVAEYFVLRAHRRSGIGREAVHRLWSEMRGSWIVRVSAATPGALPFWREVIAEHSQGHFLESTRTDGARTWHVLSFRSDRA